MRIKLFISEDKSRNFRRKKPCFFENKVGFVNFHPHDVPSKYINAAIYAIKL